MKKKSGAENRKAKKQRLYGEKKLKVQMQKYFIKPGTIDNKNPQQGKSQSPQQCSSSMNVDGQGLNLESQSYGHNDDIHVQGKLSPNDSGNNVENVHHNEANVSSNNNQYLSEMDIEEDLFERDRTKENKEPQTDDDRSSYEDSVKRTSPSKSVDVDETFVVSSVIGKSFSYEEKLTLLDKEPCQPSKAVLLKRKKKIGQRGRCCSVGLFRRKDGSKRSWLTFSLDNDALYCIPFLLFSDEVLREKVNGKIKAMTSSKQVFQIGRTSSNTFESMKNPNLTLTQR